MHEFSCMISTIFIERNAMSEPVFTFRLATPDDAEVLQAIYAPYVETTVTFEYVAPTVEEFRQRIIDRVSVYPTLCARKTACPLATPTRAVCTSARRTLGPLSCRCTSRRTTAAAAWVARFTTRCSRC